MNHSQHEHHEGEKQKKRRSGHESGKHVKHGEHEGRHQDHHAHMVADFRKRFRISLAASFPILILSPMLQSFAGLRESLKFAGDAYLL